MVKFNFIKQIAEYIIYVGKQRCREGTCHAQDEVAGIYSALLDVEKYIVDEMVRIRQKEREK